MFMGLKPFPLTVFTIWKSYTFGFFTRLSSWVAIPGLFLADSFAAFI